MDHITLLREGGPIMPLILVSALAGYALCFERLIAWGQWFLADRPFYRAETRERIEALLAGPRRHPTPLFWLLSCAAACRGEPSGRREQRMELELLAGLPRVEARIATIGWLGGILPMLGLLGTVSGMIATFDDLALTTSRQVLSQGLSEALWTTEVGLLGALPLLAVHHLLTRLKNRWLNLLELRVALLFESEGERERRTGTAERHDSAARREPGQPSREAHEA